MTIEIGPVLAAVILGAPFVWYATRFLWREINTERAIYRARRRNWAGVSQP